MLRKFIESIQKIVRFRFEQQRFAICFQCFISYGNLSREYFLQISSPEIINSRQISHLVDSKWSDSNISENGDQTYCPAVLSQIH